MTSNQVVVKLNVGGVRYETSLSNLIRYPESMLGRWFLDWNDSKEEKFIDFDGATFSFVLEFLRHGPFMVLPKDAKTMDQLRLAADYFALDGLKEVLASEFAGIVGRTLSEGALVKFSRFGIASLYESLLAYGFQSDELSGSTKYANLGFLYPAGDAWKCLCPGCNTASASDRIWNEAIAAAGAIKREMLCNSMSQMKFAVLKDHGMCVHVKQGCFTFLKQKTYQQDLLQDFVLETVVMTSNQVVVKLNVGGVRYETSRSNLIRYPESMLGRWFLDWNDSKEEKFIDFDGPTFSFILEFLRHGPFMVLPENAKTLKQLRLAAEYFMLDDLKEFLAAEFAGLVGSTLSEGALVTFSRYGVSSLYKSLLAYGFQSEELCCNVTGNASRIWSDAMAAAGETEREMLSNSMSQMKFAVVEDYGMCVDVKQDCISMHDSTSEFSSANSESGLSDLEKAGFNQNDDADAEGEESVENGVVVGESAGSEDDVLKEELCHGSLDRANPNEEMPNCDEQANDLTASDYRRILTPDFEPSSRRAKEFQLPFARFTRGVSAFADLRRASVTKCFHGEDDEADEFLHEIATAAWQAREKGVELQDDPDLDDVFTDDENDPRIVQPSFKWDLQAGCTLEQFWEVFRANPVEPGGVFDRKAFWEKYCRDRELPIPEFEEYVDCEQPEEEQASSGSEQDAGSEVESDQESVYENAIEANADKEVMAF